MLKQIVITVLVLFSLYKVVDYFKHRAMDTPSGVIAPNEPVQDNLSNAASFNFKGYNMTPVANYEFKARLLAKENYSMDDSAKLSPVDLGISWGKMSDSDNLKEIDFSQSNRFLHYRYSEKFPVDINEMQRSVANVHIIPANDDVAKKIANYRVGSVVHLRGKLVNISGDNFEWQTSTTRTDTGGGACEVMFVELANSPSSTDSYC
ncbi:MULTISPECIES: hypothetical protein [unclassified Acinetobacter]|uniref:hypothetical protein n=1 Tax=unclassified Acinetobacter TaxID=196816 RepID=UPI0035B7CFAB